MLKKWYIIFVIACLFITCKEQDLKQYPVTIDYGYFPLEKDFWREFEVTHISVDSASKVYDTISYYLREEFKGWITDAANDSVMRIERYYRDSLNQQWQPQGVWQASIIDNEAQQVEENIRYFKLEFPLTDNSSWYGDKYNRLDTIQQYKYKIASIDQPLILNGFTFDSVLTVIQKDKQSSVDKVEFKEQYAYGIGLISKTQIDIYSSITDLHDISIEERVTNGTLYCQEIIAYDFD